MSTTSTRRPSPALVISVLALFVAIGGSAYAASKVGTKDIRAGAITTAKIKNEAVTGPKIRKDAVTGDRILESTLGTVPTATDATNAVNATNATSAVNAINAQHAANFDRFYTSGLRKASEGQTIPLGAIGPFTFVGKCEVVSPGNLNAATYILTSQPNSFMYSTEGQIFNKADFQPGTEARLGLDVANTTPEWQAANGYESDWSAASPDGSLLLAGFANVGVHVFGADCAFNLNWIDQS